MGGDESDGETSGNEDGEGPRGEFLPNGGSSRKSQAKNAQQGTKTKTPNKPPTMNKMKAPVAATSRRKTPATSAKASTPKSRASQQKKPSLQSSSSSSTTKTPRSRKQQTPKTVRTPGTPSKSTLRKPTPSKPAQGKALKPNSSSKLRPSPYPQSQVQKAARPSPLALPSATKKPSELLATTQPKVKPPVPAALPCPPMPSMATLPFTPGPSPTSDQPATLTGPQN